MEDREPRTQTQSPELQLQLRENTPVQLGERPVFDQRMGHQMTDDRVD